MRLRSSPPDTREFNPGGIGKASSELGITFKARHPSKGLVALEISAVGAKTVEVSGDFTAWKPVRLTPSPDGVWRISLPIAVGAHQVNVRVNGGRWLVPPGLTPITDEFGGAVGLLVIE